MCTYKHLDIKTLCSPKQKWSKMCEPCHSSKTDDSILSSFHLYGGWKTLENNTTSYFQHRLAWFQLMFLHDLTCSSWRMDYSDDCRVGMNAGELGWTCCDLLLIVWISPEDSQSKRSDTGEPISILALSTSKAKRSFGQVPIYLKYSLSLLKILALPSTASNYSCHREASAWNKSINQRLRTD